MDRSIFRFGLPGGRRLFVVYVPAKPKTPTTFDPKGPTSKYDAAPFDWGFAHHGIFHAPFSVQETRRGKRTR